MTAWLVEQSFWRRGLALLALMFFGCALEFVLRRQRAQRYKEYTVWLGFALCGAAFGALNDALTSALSPDYFVLGKGLPAGPGLRWAAVDLGAQAGASAGILVGGVLLLANTPRPKHPALPYRALARVALLPVLLAAMGAPLCALCASFDLQGLEPVLSEQLEAHDLKRFLLVQRAHLGAYVGAVLGTLAAVIVIKKTQGAAACAPPQAQAPQATAH